MELFLLKKHYCVQCGNRLNRKKIIRIIDENSEEAHKHRIGFVGDIGGSDSGDVKLTTYYLECKECNRTFTVKEQREIEKEKKLLKKEEKRKQKELAKAGHKN